MNDVELVLNGVMLWCIELVLSRSMSDYENCVCWTCVMYVLHVKSYRECCHVVSYSAWAVSVSALATASSSVLQTSKKILRIELRIEMRF